MSSLYECSQVGTCDFHFRQDPVCVIEELFSCDSEGDTPTQSIEQPELEFVLECLDGVADRRLSKVKFTCRESEAAYARECREGEQLAAIEDGRHGDVREIGATAPN